MSLFKQLTNVRPAGTTNPELSTTPTSGSLKLNDPGASKIGVGNGDLVTIVTVEQEGEWKGTWISKGKEAVTETKDGKEVTKEAQIGAKLATPGKKNAGSLIFSSENAWESLQGNAATRRIFSIGDAMTHPEWHAPLHKLEFVREEAKAEKKAKGAKA